MRALPLLLVLVSCDGEESSARHGRAIPESHRFVLGQPIPNNCRMPNAPCEVRTLTVREGTNILGDIHMDAGHIYAHGITLSAIPGDDAIIITNSGAHAQIGPGVNESIFGTGGSGPQTPGSWTAGGEIQAGVDGYRVLTANTWKARGFAPDSGVAFQMIAGDMPVDGGTHMQWQCGTPPATVAAMSCEGYLKSKTPEVLASLYTNAVNNANTYGGWYLTQPFTITHVAVYVNNASGTGTNNILRITDGSNNCDATFSCTTDINTTGVKAKVTTGTCNFAAGASLVLSETTAGCTPDPTLKSITLLGWNQ